MRIGVLSDLHANRVALDAVLADLPEVDRLVCAGDVVGYNPWPGDCVDALRDPVAALRSAGNPGAIPDDHGPVATVLGNHDRAVVRETTFRFNDMAAAGVEHSRRSLSGEQVDWLADCPPERRLFDGRLKLVHGHPEDPDRYTRPADFSPALLGDELALVMGHTHVQHHERYEAGVALNPGSVGQPRDRDPRAGYAVLDLDTLAVDERRVDYDVERVQAAIREAGLPKGTADRLAEGR